MNSIFSFQNPFTQFLVKLTKLLWLNVLWIVCSIPIVTLGASTAALYYTAMRLSADEEGYLTRDFFHAFKSSFAGSTALFFLIVVVAAVCVADFLALGQSASPALKLFAFFILGFLFCFSLAAVYFLPLAARFKGGVADTFRRALLIAAGNLHWSFCLLILNVLLPLVILFKFLPLVVFGPALPVFLQSYILNSIFKKETLRSQALKGA